MRYILSVGDYSATENIFVVTPPEGWNGKTAEISKAFDAIERSDRYQRGSEVTCAWARWLNERGWHIELVGAIYLGDLSVKDARVCDAYGRKI